MVHLAVVLFLLVAGLFSVRGQQLRDYELINVSGDVAPHARKFLFMGNQDNNHHDPPGLFAVLEPVFKDAGIDLVFSGDKADINAANLAGYDAMLMYGNLNSSGVIDYGDTPEMDALVGFVEEGKGLIGVHVASAAYRFTPRFTSLLGGKFRNHQVVTFSPQHVLPSHPILRGLGTYVALDENYYHQDFNTDLTVLQVRPHATGNESHTWVRTQGAGRVFYTAGGHYPAVWAHEEFQQLVTRGSLWASKGEFGALGSAAIAADGTVTFSGSLGDGAVTALWCRTAGITKLLAQDDAAAAGLPAGWEFALDQLGVAIPVNGSAVLVAASEEAVAGMADGIWGGIGSAQANRLIQGGGAPYFPAGYLYTSVGTQVGEGVVANPSGETIYRVVAEHPVTGGPLSGIVSNVEGAVCMTGDPVAGVTFGDLSMGSLTINSGGDCAFTATLAGVSVTPDDEAGLFLKTASAVTLIYREGEAVPGLGGAVLFDAFGQVRVNDRGDLLFEATLRDGGASASDDRCLFLRDGAAGGLVVVAREGASVDGLVFQDSIWGGGALLGGWGQVAFFSSMAGAGVTAADDRCLWSYSAAGQLRLVAREGSPAPGVPGADFGSDFGDFPAALNAAGLIAFTSSLSGAGIDGTNDAGLWIGSAGALDLGLRKGDQQDFGTGVPGEVTALSMAGGGGAQDGLASALNDQQQLVLSASGAGGESAIFLIDDIADLDGDGIANLLEHALGSDPTVPTSSTDVLPELVELAGESRFTYLRNQALLPEQYLIELSTDLSVWVASMGAAVIDADQSGVPAGFDRVYVAIPSGASRQFARLTILP